MELLHKFLILVLILNTLSIFVSKNPIHAVLFLILIFCQSAIILFLFNVEFLGLIFVIVYVGAIAILFLFIVMMLNIKVFKYNFFIYFSILSIFSFILGTQIFLFLENTFSNFNFFNSTNDFLFTLNYDYLTNVDLLGQLLYNNFLICFLLVGLLLLIPLIGAIVLTLNLKTKH